MYSVHDFFEKHKAALNMTLITGEKGLKRAIQSPDAQRPGISLTGFLKKYPIHGFLVFGSMEVVYLRSLDKKTRKERIQGVVTLHTPAVIVTGRRKPPRELVEQCEEKEIPLLRAEMKTMKLLSKMIFLLGEDFAASITCHGTLVEVFGVGLLIEGSSSVGKSEAALSLIERGHRLVSDDIVRVKVREGSHLEGSGPDLTRHLMEIRGIGIINVAHLYGAVCVRDEKRLDLVVKLEEWDDRHFYDRIGLEEKTCDLLGIKLPYHVLPVKPGRDVALLLETIVLNHRLKEMGYNSAKEFNTKLLDAIAKKQQQVREIREKSGSKSKG